MGRQERISYSNTILEFPYREDKSPNRISELTDTTVQFSLCVKGLSFKMVFQY